MTQKHARTSGLSSSRKKKQRVVHQKLDGTRQIKMIECCQGDIYNHNMQRLTMLGCSGLLSSCSGSSDCTICSENYTSNLGATCSPCSGNSGGIAVMAASATICALVVASSISYLVSGEEESDRLILCRLTRNIPLQSVKIIIVAWQILTQVSTVVVLCKPKYCKCQSFLSRLFCSFYWRNTSQR